MAAFNLTINGERKQVDVDPATPLLWVLRDNLNLTGTKYGCGMDLKVENGKPTVEKVTCAIDCGIVINPDAAANMAEGDIVDGIGNAFYGEMTFTDGVPQKNNFHQYRMIRMAEAPKQIEVHFVDNGIDPTGLGEPPFPPIFGAVANALCKATGKRYYQQPFFWEKSVLG